GERKRRRGKGAARRRLHRPSIEHETEAALTLHDADLLVEAAPQLRAHGAARRLDWVDRLVAEQLLKNIAHRKISNRVCVTFPQRRGGTGPREARESPRGRAGCAG